MSSDARPAWTTCSPVQNPDAKDELVTTTVRDYDLAETGKAMKALFTGMAFMAFLHLYMGYIPPVSTTENAYAVDACIATPRCTRTVLGGWGGFGVG